VFCARRGVFARAGVILRAPGAFFARGKSGADTA